MSELGRLVTELQVHGVADPALPGNRGRRGGAGPSDHRALTIDGATVMVPVYNSVSKDSPYILDADDLGAVTDRFFTGIALLMAFPTVPLPCCMVVMCWPPRCFRPASASAIGRTPVSSVR